LCVTNATRREEGNGHSTWTILERTIDQKKTLLKKRKGKKKKGEVCQSEKRCQKGHRGDQFVIQNIDWGKANIAS